MDLSSSLVGALRHCRRFRALKPGRSVHALVIRLGLSGDVYFANNLISMYVGSNELGDAHKLFDGMPYKNLVTWGTMVSAYANAGEPEVALGLYHRMLESGSETPNEFVYSAVVKACGLLGDLDLGRRLHSRISAAKLESDTVLMNSLINMYVRCGSVSDARRVFGEISQKTSVSWNTMIFGYCEEGLMDEALSLFHQMPGRNVVSWNSIVADLYAKHGNIQIALRLFDLLPQRDILAWSGLIAGCAKMGYDLFALSLFREMMASGVYVDEFVISCIIKICSSLASIRNGKQVHALSVKSGYELEEVTVTSLIDMYSKCGDIEEGLKLFGSTLIKGTVCWTAIIMGCAQNGRAMEAIKLFYEMLQTGQKPNEVTFLAVLAACRHAGLIEEAKTVFSSMGSEHGLVPHCEHYYCMVDLLGQFGHFEEAEKLISSMPFKPDKTIWCSLLEACASHGKTELVDGIAENLLAISPEDPSIYVMLSNVYATLGMWANLTKVRKSAKKLGTKEAGKSWVEIST
ncbi:hypothetical protein EUGRSUZ_F03753 [Eucalyptus grandis]|uniref:Pentacotripeptide-repeat region of PRORP domain-containing protein n=3 Tax=Eucalyptus grandis TaxID=71139 RepID=A0A059BX70_EUCGR|nr:hypothetical protein EUGRSUZ_F03753 [Eucalyptus grandis]KAK3427559.1 hypothetical protein EUGRSUZ_F03753 [Eucalyptus grandis]